jgi:thioredoxin-like negative regulator of GroEL
MMLERSVYSASAFKAQSKYFVFCKINVDEQKAVAQQWQVTALPTIKFLNPKDLSEIHGFIGGMPLHPFIAEMNKARGAR